MRRRRGCGRRHLVRRAQRQQDRERSTPATAPSPSTPSPRPNASPLGITVGSGGTLWFTEGQGNKIGKASFVAPPAPAGSTGGACAPNITGLIPDAGPAGSQVTIIGTQLSCATGVRFGDAPALAFTIDDDQHITARAPDHDPGQVAVRVLSATSASPIVLAGRFTYTAAPTQVAPPTDAPSAARLLRCARLPRLTGYTLAQARRVLARDHCVTSLRVRRTAPRRHDRVPRITGQATRPGTPLYARDRGVQVTLPRRPRPVSVQRDGAGTTCRYRCQSTPERTSNA